MREQFREYLIKLYQDIPTEVYEGLISVLCIGAVGLIAIFGWKRGWRWLTGLLLGEYVVMIYCSTVICRKVSESIIGHNFNLFWSYEAIKNGRDDLIAENIMNAVVFVPVGILLGLLLRVKGAWSVILAIGMVISISVEALQYYLSRGFSELDDVIHNTLGCLIGYSLILITSRTLWLLQKRY